MHNSYFVIGFGQTIPGLKKGSTFSVSISLCFVLTFLFFCNSAVAQNFLPRKYKTNEYQQILLAEDDRLADKIKSQEQKISRTIGRVRPLRDITLPIIFHIVGGEPAQTINEQRINSQIEALNRDFNQISYENRHPADVKEGFKDRRGEVNLTFCLADTHDKGVRVVSETFTGEWGVNNLVKQKPRGSEADDPKNYINIWVAKMEEGSSGYAQMPGGPQVTDGIVIDYRFFGDVGAEDYPYSQGKTLTHLMGNYLGLHEMWGPGYCADDYVKDTPVHSSPNHGCGSDYKHVSLCDGRPVEMSMNFMDNSFDECSYMFTQGQVQRILAFLSPGLPRASLINGRNQCAVEDAEQLYSLDGNKSSLEIKSAISVTPNPAQESFTVSLDDSTAEGYHLVVYGIAGDIVYQKSGDFLRARTINCSTWRPGIYMLVYDDGQVRYTSRLVIE